MTVDTDDANETASEQLSNETNDNQDNCDADTDQLSNQECEEQHTVDECKEHKQVVPDDNTPKELVSNLDGKYWNSSLIHVCLAATTDSLNLMLALQLPNMVSIKESRFLRKRGMMLQ